MEPAPATENHKKSKLRKMKNKVVAQYIQARQYSYAWFHAKIMPKLSPRA